MNRALLGCTVAPAKIERHLPDLGSAEGRSKARFFLAFGFAPSRPDIPARALQRHGETQVVSANWTDVWGKHWNVTGPLAAPDGRRPTVRSAWIKDSQAPPRLATALPA